MRLLDPKAKHAPEKLVHFRSTPRLMPDPREYEGDPKKPIDEDDSNNNNGPLGSCHTHLPLVVVVPAVQIDH